MTQKQWAFLNVTPHGITNEINLTSICNIIEGKNKTGNSLIILFIAAAIHKATDQTKCKILFIKHINKLLVDREESKNMDELILMGSRFTGFRNCFMVQLIIICYLT